MIVAGEEVGLSMWKGPLKTNRRITMLEICGQIAEEYGLTVEIMRGPARHKLVSVARQHAMYEMAKQPHLSFPMIGRFLGNRDHTTILHGKKRHQERLDREARGLS